MKLKEQLELFGNNELLHIGSQSGFFFIGTKSEFEKDCAGIEEYYKDLFKRSQASAQSKLVDAQALAIKTSKQGTDWRGYAHKLEAYGARLREALDVYEDASRKVNEFTPFLDREVYDVYVNISIDGGKDIILYGDEVGKYWLKNEYNNKKGER